MTHPRRKITVAAVDPFASAYPRRYGAALPATFADGSTRVTAAPDARGDPEHPMRVNELVAKARPLMIAATLDHGRVESIVGAALALPRLGAVADLTARLP